MGVVRDGVGVCCIVGAVLGLAHVGAKHMGVHWFFISNNGVIAGIVEFVPLFVQEGIKCIDVLWS
ncbi:hypothetical protein [Bartonella sp. B39]